MTLVLIYLSTALSFIICTVYATRSWSYRRSYTHGLIFLIESTYALWAFSLISVFAMEDMQFKIFMTHARQLLLPLICPAWTLLTAALFFPQLSDKLRRHLRWVFLFPAIVISGNILSMLGFSFAEKWIFYDFYLLPGLSGLVGFTRGALLKSSFGYNTICVVAAFGISFYAYATLRGRRRFYVLVMMLAGIWPTFVEAWARMAHTGNIPWAQLTVLGLWPAVWGMHYAASRVDLLEIVSLAQQKVFEHLPSPVIILNTRGEFWDANLAAKHSLHLQENWRGRTAADIPLLAEITNTVGKYQVADRSYQVIRHTLDFHGGESQAKIFVLNDVSELEESNRTLRDLNGAILQMTRFNKKVQTVLAHDLSGALSGVQILLGGVIQQLQRSGDSESLSSLHRASEANKSSLALLQNLLTWSYEEENIHKVEFKERVRTAVSQLSPQVLQKNITMNLKLPDQDIILTGSGKVVEAIVRNILSNAVKFSPVGGQIDIHGQLVGAHIELVIQDQGPGISEELALQLSDPTAPIVAHGEGFGLGLRFTTDFVAQMGGMIQLKASEPQGTRVSVKFPLFV
ncbi:ATP-binding protein [Bdellovibrio bacteriovorus]|uniref:sensor histidine kinase n=1 Tax=Bdellovibrio bacteriovorus TaxID=959 RepID=UPI0021CEF9A4|nr:ATP-binding protein [Bdellovibrio bacteriovorus]UXR66055.1 ATP-binding protein [Bdellovibrio bacteriovorus]